MHPLMIIGIILAIFLLFILLLSFFGFLFSFYASGKASKEEYPLPKGKHYEPYLDLMVNWIKEVRQMPHEECVITSFDGLKLYGNYYEYDKNAPMELMFHGYRGSAERDLSGGVKRCFDLGRNVLIVDQRTSCRSEGHVISFGANEYRDCLSWIDFCIDHFGPDVKIILTGISMGASTVLMAASRPLPKNVVGVLADCGYTSSKAIIQKCIRQMHLPIFPVYPLVKLGAKLWGRFDLEACAPVDILKDCTIPVIFAHGEADALVPCDMSRINYEACTCAKRIFTVPGAGHGLAYLADPENYLKNLSEFFTENGVPTRVIGRE